ncbi:hypothetical protein QJQ45_028181 [Haematococcus lacustris]|nr:hypothetical protein QJQ45_028181 [Haematococcus lacustris]
MVCTCLIKASTICAGAHACMIIVWFVESMRWRHVGFAVIGLYTAMAPSNGTAPSVLLRRGEPRDLSVLVAYNIVSGMLCIGASPCAPTTPLLRCHMQAMAKETENIDLERDIITAGVQKVLEGKTSASYYILEEDGMVVAQLMITFEWSDWRAADIWWIQSVYVAPAARKRGYFRKLYEYVRQEAEACKAVGLRLYADSKNLPAQATYKKLGMRTHYLVRVGFVGEEKPVGTPIVVGSSGTRDQAGTCQG